MNLASTLKLLLFFFALAPVTSMISLNSRISSGTVDPPLIILVHGLDSSSRTWDNTMESIDASFVAVDQRGSGYSPLGKPQDFSQIALVNDLHQVISSNTKNNEKVILLGHSLGGRIVLGYAATHPDRVASVIIEDMDIEERSPDTHGIVQLKPYHGCFDRERETKDLLIQALETVGYSPSFIEKGLASGRIEANQNADPPGSTWWTHINPDFRKLCYEHVLSTSQGRKDCQRISSLLKVNKNEINFPVHLLVAGNDGTVCIEESIQEMKQILGDALTIHRFLNAGHSIHSTEPQKYCESINSIILQARAKL
jgi:pimeloyl-ACP methyl ester carboxylesterase